MDIAVEHRNTTAARPVSISEHNARVRWFLEASLVSLVRRAVLYEVRSSRPRLVLIPARDDWDPACGAFANTEDLDFDNWFGGNHVIESVNYFPGTDCFLANGYDIVMLHSPEAEYPPAANSTVRRMFDAEWFGNLLVVKRGCRDYSRAVSITRSEVSLVNTLVERWIQVNGEQTSSSDAH